MENYKFRVTPRHKNGYSAPYQIIKSNEDDLWKARKKVIETARENTRLSDFDSWHFIAELIPFSPQEIHQIRRHN